MKPKSAMSACLVTATVTVTLTAAGCTAAATSARGPAPSQPRGTASSGSGATASPAGSSPSPAGSSPGATPASGQATVSAHTLAFKVTSDAPVINLTCVVNGKKTSRRLSALPATVTIPLPPHRGPDDWQLMMVTAAGGSEQVTILVDGRKTGDSSESGAGIIQLSGEITDAGATVNIPDL